MKISITCENCGRRHRLERLVSEPGPIWIVCHDCELPLQAAFDLPDAHQTQPAPRLWAGFFDGPAATDAPGGDRPGARPLA
jgi:hypothetical protein